MTIEQFNLVQAYTLLVGAQNSIASAMSIIQNHKAWSDRNSESAAARQAIHSLVGVLRALDEVITIEE